MKADRVAEFMEAHALVRDYTLTDRDAQFALWRECQRVQEERVPGEFVECGVWKGGSVALAWKAFRSRPAGMLRGFWLFDTFEGMPPHGEHDRAADGVPVKPEDIEGDKLAVSRELVMENLCLLTGEPEDVRRGTLPIEGRVERELLEPFWIDTLRERGIAVLHLDTDWYESTKVELEVLWPLVSPGGAVIVDDYGFWRGSRLAADEFRAQLEDPPPLINEGPQAVSWRKP